MRKVCASENTFPTFSMIFSAECRSWPMGFSSTTRDFSVTRPAVPSAWQIGPYRSGEVAR